MLKRISLFSALVITQLPLGALAAPGDLPVQIPRGVVLLESEIFLAQKTCLAPLTRGAFEKIFPDVDPSRDKDWHAEVDQHGDYGAIRGTSYFGSYYDYDRSYWRKVWLWKIDRAFSAGVGVKTSSDDADRLTAEFSQVETGFDAQEPSVDPFYLAWRVFRDVRTTKLQIKRFPTLRFEGLVEYDDLGNPKDSGRIKALVIQNGVKPSADAPMINVDTQIESKIRFNLVEYRDCLLREIKTVLSR